MIKKQWRIAVMKSVSETVADQRAFFASGTTKDVSFRITQLKKLRDAIRRNEKLVYDAPITSECESVSQQISKLHSAQ